MNKNPFFLEDSKSYITAGATVFEKVFNRSTDWSCKTHKYSENKNLSEIEKSIPSVKEKIPAFENHLQDQLNKNQKAQVIKGRSIYYGIFLFFSSWLGSLWTTIFFQALVSVYVIFNILTLFKIDIKKRLIILLILGTLTSLPFFSSFLMPDFWTGLVIICGASLGLATKLKKKHILTIILSVLIMGGISHDSLILLNIFMFFCWLGIGFKTKNQKPAFLCLVPILISFIGSFAFDISTKHFYGEYPIRPPFLSGRLLEEEIGSKWLNENCNSVARFTLCNFPQARNSYDTNTYIWSLDPEKGIWSALPQEIKKKISSEDFKFAKEVFLSFPLLTIKKTLEDIIDLSFNFNLYDFYKITGPINTCQKKVNETETKPNRIIPIRFYSIIQSVFLLSCVLSISYLFFMKSFRYLSNEKKYFLGLCLLSYFANATISAALSGTFTRYNSRALWIIPFISLIIIYEKKKIK